MVRKCSRMRDQMQAVIEPLASSLARYTARSKRVREPDSDSDDLEGASWRNRHAERMAEMELRAMSFEAREHCARYPHWQLLSWEERLRYARDPNTLHLCEEEIVGRREEREISKLMKSVRRMSMETDHVIAF
eukprot:TRINITY_DN19182_c0_g1_i1.p2 TRINITY_DN19182_c0_g1~~TRINITY_DN19182_c0_g1_i1.p2  ORF type:complete len:133 (-),score=16.68 TRINITY_DN19182_c0_g1_i1:467-865(-)